MNKNDVFNLSCPIPLSSNPNVLLAHGGGGTLMNTLIEKIFREAFNNAYLNEGHDGAVVDVGCGRIAMTTDSFVVNPLFFPGGDIGSLAVFGTVNDLAMCGARPLYLTAGFIIEEGLPMETLWEVACSMKKAADIAGVKIVTGDTKVVDKGKGDGLFINTSGVGTIINDISIKPSCVEDSDAVILSGDIGRHGMAVMAARKGLEFESRIESDAASLVDIASNIISSKAHVHCMRDLTRGGLASALVEIAQKGGLDIQIEERDIPVREDVHAACEILGFDPVYVANEGRFICFVNPLNASAVLDIMRAHPMGESAKLIGTVKKPGAGTVKMKSSIGTTRLINMLSGEQLPRIC